MPHVDSPVHFDPEGILWQLADVCDSRDSRLRFNERIELLPPSREAHSPVQSRRGLERQASATWRGVPSPPPATPSLPSSTTLLPVPQEPCSLPPVNPPSLPPSSTTLLPFQTQEPWSLPPANPPPNPPRRRPRHRAPLAPLGANEQALAREVRTLEMENLDLRKHLILQDRALVALAKLRTRPVS